MISITRAIPHMHRLAALGAPRVITYHCTATPEGRNDRAEKIVGMDEHSYGQPSYHFVVELDGSVVQCLKLTELGAHTGKHNHYNIGVAYVGGTDVHGHAKDTRTQAQKAALRRIDADLRSAFNTITVSKGHRDWSPDRDHDGKIEPHEWVKICPCFDVATQL